MTKKAIIVDLDNTIYPVSSIGEKLFASLFQLIESSNIPAEKLPAIKEDIMRRPFQVVASHYQFNDTLMQKGIQLLQDLTYDTKIEVFPDYQELKKLPMERFLVTTGFKKLQHSKIRNMGIEQDFKEVHVVDPLTTEQTKRTVFADIIKRHHYATYDVFVVGDDPESEIKAAAELGIDTVLYDKLNRYPSHSATYKITHFKELASLI